MLISFFFFFFFFLFFSAIPSTENGVLFYRVAILRAARVELSNLCDHPTVKPLLLRFFFNNTLYSCQHAGRGERDWNIRRKQWDSSFKRSRAETKWKFNKKRCLTILYWNWSWLKWSEKLRGDFSLEKKYILEWRGFCGKMKRQQPMERELRPAALLEKRKQGKHVRFVNTPTPRSEGGG